MTRSLWLPIQITAGALLLGATVLATDKLGITNIRPAVINTTHSMPLGVYVRTWETPSIGSTVSIPMPMIMRAYVNAYPEWGKFFEHTPLLKTVVAVGGDTVCRDGDGVLKANGRVLGVAATHSQDGRALPSWNGCARLRDDEIAVFGEGVQDSLDGRYWGATPISVARVYRKVW